jgi:hypothetical protein
VSLQEKIRGYERFDILRTALDLVHLAAFATLEMVMMGLRSSLIAWRLTREINLDEPPFFNESFEGTINRGNPQTWSVRLRDLEHLLRTQRATSFFDNLSDGPALASITFHGKMVHRVQ